MVKEYHWKYDICGNIYKFGSAEAKHIYERGVEDENEEKANDWYLRVFCAKLKRFSFVDKGESLKCSLNSTVLSRNASGPTENLSYFFFP